MQLLSKAIHGILTDDTDITDTVGSGNIWHSKVPQRTTNGTDTPPPLSIYFYTYAVNPTGSTKTGRAEIDEHMIRVCIVGSDDEDMYEVARYVRYALDRITPGIYNDIPIDGTEFLNATFDPEGSYELENQSWVLEFKVRVIDDYIRDSITAPSINMPRVESGTYTPTASSQYNITSLTMRQAQYMRVGSTVTVSGIFICESTTGGSGYFKISLPIASNIGAEEDIAGVIVAQAAYKRGAIYGDAASNLGVVDFEGNSGFELYYSFTFTYQII